MSPISNMNKDGLDNLMDLPIGSWEAADLLGAREGLGLTQAELAAAIGYDRSAIAKIEGGDAPPRRVVELAVRYLVERRPQGTHFQFRDRESSRFRPIGTAIGITDRSFPGQPNIEVELAAGSAIWFRLTPEFDSGQRWTSIELKKATTQNGFPLVQLVDGYSALNFVRGPDGFGVYGVHGDYSTPPSVSFAFETGEIWGVDTYFIDAVKRHAGDVRKPGIPYFEDRFKLAMHSFRTVLTRLGIKPPFKWIAGVEGIKGCGIYYPPLPGRYFPSNEPFGPSLVDRVCVMGSMEDADTPASALKPFFAKLFSAFDVERPDYLDDLSNPRV